MRLNRFNLIIFSSNRFNLIIFNLYMKFSLNLNKNRPNNRIKNVKQNINYNFNFRSGIHYQQQSTPTIDQSIKKINIFTKKCAILSTRHMAKQLEELGIETTINLRNINNKDIDLCEKDPNLYLFILFPQWNLARPGIKVKDLPKNKYFLYQMEQLNQNQQPYQNIDIIMDSIKNSYCTFDYSSTNISLYPDNIRDKIKLLTPFIGEVKEYSEEKTIDILFIGALNERRIKILDEIKRYSRENNLDYKIEIVDNVFEDELDRLIKKSKIVINLHYYPNAILELFRIHDVLSYDCKILSELPGNGDPDGSVEKYKNVVDFFPVINDDFSNIDSMYKLIDDKLIAEIDLDERIEFILEINKINISSLNLNLKIKSYNFITFSTMGDPYDKGLNLIDKSKTIKNTIYSTNNYINYYNYNTKNIIKNYGIETKNKYISEHYDISYRCKHHYRGNTIGFWKWKPFIIFEELKKINYNDILIYYDCNIDKNPHYIDEIKNIKVSTNKILNDINFGFLYEDLNNKNLICKNYVKKDIFEKLGCTEEYFKNAPLRRANKLFIRKTKSTENLIYNWLKLTETSLFLPESNEEIMNSAHNNELYGWNTHDQAVLNILYLYYQKYNLL